jgi:hemerythrin superfamily protein
MSRPAGPHDVIDVLAGQHAEIRRAFRRAARPGRGRGDAFRRLVHLLSIHEAAEEAHVHPALRRGPSAGKAVAAARRSEEKKAKQLLASLQKTGPHGSGYLPALRTLRRAVLAHAAREEREEFPALRNLSGIRRRLLGLEVRLAQAVAPTRPHPRLNSELANKLAMPVLGPVDRCRDIVRDLTQRITPR